MEGFYSGRIVGLSNYTLTGARTGADITEESILSLVTVLGSSISLVGLVFAFITYSLFSDLRNVSGTALMNLLAALFMTQLLYVIGVGGVQDPELCIGLAFSLQYMRSTIFCWILLLSHHTFRSFTDKAHLLPPMQDDIRRVFWQYTALGWCFPVAFLVPSIFARHETSGDWSNVKDLQAANCWFLDRDSFVYGCGIPTLFLLGLIVVTLARTALVIRKSDTCQLDPKTRDKMRSKRRLQLFLYVKLTSFASTVSLLSAVYVFTKAEASWILFNVFQGTQGIVISLCVTCNCRVLKIYTRSLKKRRKHSQYAGIDLSKSTSLQMLQWDPAPDSV